MEIGIRELLIIIGGLIIAAILFDGYRRARDSRKNAIKMSLDLETLGDDAFNEYDEFIGELPGGGEPRVISNKQQLENDEILFDYSDQDLNPQLNESIKIKGLNKNNRESGQNNDFDDSISLRTSTQQDLFGNDEIKTSTETSLEYTDENELDELVVETNQNLDEPANSSEEVLLINVVAKQGKKIQGGELLGGLFNCGLHFGTMNIFHRFSHANGDGPLMFSMANMVNPGVFDLDKINDFETPGVTFFLTLPGPEKSMTAFDLMLDTVRRLSRILNAELEDEKRNPLTSEVVDEYRRRVRDFERAQLKIHAEEQAV